ncbi:MAG: hypothetical protein IKG23_09840 [Clostridia bacterium]|nr:hypothetical protein [Clostridia bacterium]
MASQEFLASFAVDIDEAGVSRLQQVPQNSIGDDFLRRWAKWAAYSSKKPGLGARQSSVCLLFLRFDFRPLDIGRFSAFPGDMTAVDAFHLVEFNREDQVNVRFGLASGDIAVMETAGSPNEEVNNSVGRLRSLSACCALHLEQRQLILFLICKSVILCGGCHCSQLLSMSDSAVVAFHLFIRSSRMGWQAEVQTPQ